MRFRPAARLNNEHVYAAVFKKGQRHYLKAGMYISLANSFNHARLGLIIAKKKIRKAHERNYIKRVQRECFRAMQPKLLGYDVVFVCNHKIGQLCQNQWFTLCQEDWRFLAKRLATV